MNAYIELLKSWCDKIIEYQITEIKDENFYGGVLCPSCSLIHGRIGDAVYPLTALYDYTGEIKYLKAAKLVVDWCENNVSRHNGGWFNDKTNPWLGTTAFAAISLGETLIHHSECLDCKTKEKWTKLFERLSEFVFNYFPNKAFNPVINYYAAYCPAMAIAYKLTKKEKYRESAYKMAKFISENHFTKDGLLFGECTPRDLITPKGCRGVDLGYNVEESLPAMIMFAHYMNDEEYLKFYAEKFKIHLEFMLPDGGWDNSWGTRANKWTYWGSRTSDGCQTALCYLSHIDDVFAEAAKRNLDMYIKCSENGLLYGGYMLKNSGEDACIHHSFCHAKSLCSMIDNNFEYVKKVKLPREIQYGTKSFDSVRINLISIGDWRATISDYDQVNYRGCATTGGTMTMLWNKNIGPVFTASGPIYNVTEPKNMQWSKNSDDIFNCTLRVSNGGFESGNDKTASVSVENNFGIIKVSACGVLRDCDYRGAGKYQLKYTFMEDQLEISAISENGGKFYLPIICEKNDTITTTNKGINIERKGFSIYLESENHIHLDTGLPDRNFNPVGGFFTAPLCIELKPNTAVKFIMFIR